MKPLILSLALLVTTLAGVAIHKHNDRNPIQPEMQYGFYQY